METTNPKKKLISLTEIYYFQVITNTSFKVNYFNKLIGSSRRDDIISLMYLLVYFVKGSLPWLNIRELCLRKKFKKIKEMKKYIPTYSICSGEAS